MITMAYPPHYKPAGCTPDVCIPLNNSLLKPVEKRNETAGISKMNWRDVFRGLLLEELSLVILLCLTKVTLLRTYHSAFRYPHVLTFITAIGILLIEFETN